MDSPPNYWSSLSHGQAANFVKTVTIHSPNSVKLTGAVCNICILLLCCATIRVIRINIHQGGGEPLNRLNWSKRLKFKLTVLICT